VSEVRLYPRIGKVANVRRLVVIRAVEGSVCCTLLIALSTSCRVRNISTDQSKKRLTSAEPRLVVERTVVNPGTLLTASSMGFVIVTCICSTGMTPLSTPMTTRGKLVSGKTEMGTWKAA
jgi:CTP-dependent riboflavin kinase